MCLSRGVMPHAHNGRWDCIQVMEQPVEEDKFKRMEEHFAEMNIKESINASPFEILTATAFSLFNKAKIEFGVIECGMGGTLDATNILNNQAVSVITKIAKDHESFLGTTLEEIARHKAGILRPNVPYIVNPMNPRSVQNVIDEYAKKIGAGPRLVGDSVQLRKQLYSLEDWQRFARNHRRFQLDNAVLATIAVKTALESEKKAIKYDMIAEELTKKRAVHPGRLQFIKVPPVFGQPGDAGREILVDGAHNPDAAEALNNYVVRERYLTHSPKKAKGRYISAGDRARPADRMGWPVTWVLAMTEGKDARQYLQKLLKPGDKVITTTFGPVDGMPWVKPMNPLALLDIARSVQPRITGSALPKAGALRALCAARYISQANLDEVIVFTGSLYFVGDLHRELRDKDTYRFWTHPDHEDDRAAMKIIHKEESARITRFLGLPQIRHGRVVSDDEEHRWRRNDEHFSQYTPRETERETAHRNKAELQAELEDVDREMDLMAITQLQRLNESPTQTKEPDRPLSSSLEHLTQRKKRLQAQLENVENELHNTPVRFSTPVRTQPVRPDLPMHQEGEYVTWRPGFLKERRRRQE